MLRPRRNRSTKGIRRALAGLACLAAAAPTATAVDEVAALESSGTGADAPLAQLDGQLDEIETLLGNAYFRTALAVASATRERLADEEPAPGLSARRARLEVLAATAELALGRNARARGSMARALEADPSLALDEARTSPRVRELLREVRRADDPTRGTEAP